MRKSSSLITTILVLFCLSEAVFSQNFKISNYGVSEGIIHPFVYTVNQDVRGFIWVGTGEGFCRFNGYEFDTEMVHDSLAGKVANISYKDKQGILWFGYSSGEIAKYDGSVYQVVNTGIELHSSITGFMQIDKNNLLISTLANGLLIVDLESGKATSVQGVNQGVTCTALYAKDNTILFGSQDGLFIYTLNKATKSVSLQSTVSELDFVKVQDIQPSSADHIFWIATEDKGVFKLTLPDNQYTLDQMKIKDIPGQLNIQSVLEDSEGQLWVCTIDKGVFRLGLPDKEGNYAVVNVFDKQSGLPGNAVKKVFEDLEGNFWVATYGSGLSLLSGRAFAFTDFQNPGIENDILSITVTDNRTYFIGGKSGLFRYMAGKDKTAARVNGIPADRITSQYLEGQQLYIGTESNGLFVMNITGTSVRKIDYEANSLGKSVNGIVSDDNNIFLATKDGIYVLDRNLKQKAHLTTMNQLPHNNIEDVFIDSRNRLLFATRTNGIYQLTPDDSVKNVYPAGNSEIEFKSITEDDKGGIWAATYGDGVIYFYHDSVFQFMSGAGLKADYCYSIVKGADKSLWVGHRLGISRINSDNLRISVYDRNIDMVGDCNLNSVYVDKSGNIYFGTTDGVVTFNPMKDKKKKLPPFTNITSLLISDKEYDFNKDIVLPYKLYKLRIEFIGLNYSDPEAIRYQYKLEGYDPEWSDITAQDYASYPRLADGEYIFHLRSFNNEGLSQEAPVTIRIRIKLPVWKTWWFISLSVIVLFLAVYFYIKIRERKQKQLQEYLERELAARTKEVVEQKEVIEIKNRDITDSINYAKRIQTSMLPPIKRLQQYFSGCFVFYSPRDIVSGDFYWFDLVNNTKFNIVCADSTGHGVPGAFMSMIGSTLIKDICTRELGSSPSQVLKVLDNELNNTLNQDIDDESKPRDGIDIIVCEIDLKTHYVRYATAMRPMIIYRNGEEIFVKGSRNSVGGHYDTEISEFEDEGIQLSKGDIIYMFSDGYSDQFGGPMGKKFKTVRLKNLLKDIHHLPMDEQYNHVKNTFSLWKENYDQVDDVLFMGIKI
jgi:ligand-binding sensor domain-containing protein/serine phosphatase RsbU (regulator of sigma subunit)